LVESKTTEKRKGRKRREPEVELKLSPTSFQYRGPARQIKFIIVILVLGIVNIFGEFGISTFPENLAALFFCMMIIAIVALILYTKKGE